MSEEDSIRSKNLLVISTGNDKKKNIFRMLYESGLNIILLDKQLTPWAKQYVKKFIKADTGDIASAVKTITDYQSKTGKQLDGVVTFWDDSVPLVAAIADKLKLPGFDYSIVKKIKHKAQYRELCQKHKIPSPGFMLLKNKQDVLLAAKKLKFPLVIKPVFGNASVFVVKVNSAKKLMQTFEYIRDRQANEHVDWQDLGLDIVAEEYIAGKEIDIDVLVQNGKIRFFSIADNLDTHEPFFVETGFNYPSVLSKKQQLLVRKLTEKTIREFKLQNGCLHYEAKVEKNKVVPIELNLRLGGDGLEKIIEDCYAIDIVELIAKIALGMPIPDLNKIEPIYHIMGRYLLPDRTGTIKAIKVPKDIEKLSYLQSVYIGAHVGDKVRIPPAGYDYLGWLNVICEDHNDCQKKLAHLMKQIKITIA